MKGLVEGPRELLGAPAEEGRVAVADPRCSHSASQILRPPARPQIPRYLALQGP